VLDRTPSVQKVGGESGEIVSQLAAIGDDERVFPLDQQAGPWSR